MEITYRHDITIRDLVAGFQNDKETGRVRGFHGLLDIRPAYQREFVYNLKQQEAVMNSVENSFPLNVMYWVKRENIDEEKTIKEADKLLEQDKAEDIEAVYEVLDGQQRTLSICSYINDEFSRNFRYYHNLTDEEKEAILDYPLTIYICEGTDKEKLDWFKVINTATEKLTDQELRNAVYAGTWLTDAKKYFSKVNGPADQISDGYVNAKVNRQELLETAISWISKGEIEEYMAKNQDKSSAAEFWNEFNKIITWIETVFTKKRPKEMKSVDWGYLYYKYKDIITRDDFDSVKIEERVKELMMNEDIQKKSGIYYYVLGEGEKYLNLRAFSDADKRTMYERQNGKCANPKCENKDKIFEYEEMEGDHIKSFAEGGSTTIENLQMLCKKCNGEKGAK